MKAKVSDVFFSVQGEGIYIGYPQVFVRFWGCNLKHCRFCDTQGEKYQEYSVKDLIDLLLKFDKKYHSISITGGEPLLQAEFLKQFFSVYKNKHQIYLETNGTLPAALEMVIDYADIIAMDIKLPSATGLAAYWEEHKKFLLIAWEKILFVKTVITRDTIIEDLKKAVDLILSVDSAIPLVLQPATEEISPQLRDKLLLFQEEALKYLSYVRIIPQLHKFIFLK